MAPSAGVMSVGILLDDAEGGEIHCVLMTNLPIQRIDVSTAQ